MPSTVYLIHFDEPLKQARHYIGYTCLDNVEDRVKKHKSGTGARILNACNLAGITYSVVMVWELPDPHEARMFEKKLKKLKNAPRICPVCKRKHK